MLATSSLPRMTPCVSPPDIDHFRRFFFWFASGEAGGKRKKKKKQMRQLMLSSSGHSPSHDNCTCIRSYEHSDQDSFPTWWQTSSCGCWLLLTGARSSCLTTMCCRYLFGGACLLVFGSTHTKMPAHHSPMPERTATEFCVFRAKGHPHRPDRSSTVFDVHMCGPRLWPSIVARVFEAIV